MFRTYLLPVEAALTLFPLIAALILGPAAIHGYRRRGRAGGWPVLVFYSFVFYLLAAVLQTVMPLPADTDAHCATIRYAESPQLQPFAFHARIASAAGGDWSVSTLAGLGSTWTTLLNAMLLLPLGVYLRYYFRQRLLPATVVALATSLFFETTQYTGLWFVYACPYRQFNVDDLSLNTAGAVAGWLIAGPLARLLPANNPDRERTRYGHRVTLTRRALAFLTDLAGWLVIWTLTTGLLAVGTDWTTGRRYALTAGAVLGLVWFWLLPVLFATTPGKRAVLLRLARPDGSRPGFWRITARAWTRYSPLALAWLAIAHHNGTLTLPDPAGAVLPYAALLAAVVVWGSPPLVVMIRRDRRAWYERWFDIVNHPTADMSSRSPARTPIPAGRVEIPAPAPAPSRRADSVETATAQDPDCSP
ncbi:VanZ family protein [Streptomyces antarcticus]|uniref:VanZ family protein n=1 Tax=Streptomyces antarcticus TaxID=2996458 RepID=UPI00226DBED2|nr:MULTISPECIES: VanZ family protein [unclassified Streptomyces]MCY0940483.1 VanZ family protein [Streptomyces sp. H34-AA3]MCZ4082398.1 VanZ family protein [Streptomyces sp. H34-S5]